MALAIEWVTVSAIAAPHVLYAAVWLFPNVWRSIFAQEPVKAFQRAATLGKVTQFATCVAWFVVQTRAHGTSFRPWHVPWWAWLASLALLAYGQALNIGVYKAIGQDGVYYGCRLGKKVKWCRTFPFSVVSHPQYVGSVLTVWGLVVLLQGQAPPGLLVLGAFWSTMYLVTALVEQYL